ncbi:hypothetical protein GH5_07738 [Leishmania sp. Ghana 2012 LV757]|uniref:hypothetical protein n=1 Tax=Leishmania sp. Ghana 2012 LV757 TaxID=2803181 RepID=UPI001B73178F|nr:hypothetical protein GH5_07738 [Leishmania sp. Ghana 2012 LV757]
MSSTPHAPRPVIAKRHQAPQYLAPGQYLKVASRKPAPKLVDAGGCDRFAGGPPRDPWANLDSSAEEVRSSSAGYSASPEHHRHHTTGGGHPHSDRVSVSRKSTDGTSPHGKERSSDSGLAPATTATPPTDDLTAAGYKHVGRGAAAGSDEDDVNYYSTPELPELSAAERAQRVLEAQHRALEAKQLKALIKQGVARRPKTLVRNRHGRLNAITAGSAFGTEEGSPALLICNAPVKPSSHPEKMQSPSSKAPGARLVRSAPRGGECGSDGAVESPRSSRDILVESRPSTQLQATSRQLEIDLG